MIKDEERREVARKLREYVDLPDDWWQETCAEFYVEKCVFGNVDRHSEAELFTRLADLIEPAPERTYHPERIGTAYRSALMCSACKYPLDEVTVYCPHCGARLEGVSHGER